MRTIKYLVALPLLMAAGPVPAPVVVPVPPGTVCEVALAHWFTQRYVAGAAGIVIPFRFNPTDETVTLINTGGIEMAVEGLICGGEDSLHARGQRLDFRALTKTALR